MPILASASSRNGESHRIEDIYEQDTPFSDCKERAEACSPQPLMWRMEFHTSPAQEERELAFRFGPIFHASLWPFALAEGFCRIT
jgi:hypothetical protein